MPMRKVTKIMGKVLAATILLLLVLPVVVSVLLDLPAVQNFIVRHATRAVSERLETVVSIDRVAMSLSGKARIYGFYVEDYEGDTLLYVARLDAYVGQLGLRGGGIELSRTEIDGARLYLRETPSGVMNIKQVVARLADPKRKKKGTFRLKLTEASISGMELRLQRRSPRNPVCGIDFGDMHLMELNAAADDFTIDGAAIYTTISSLSLRERCGFRLDELSGRFFLTQGCIGFENAVIRTERSEINIPYISLLGTSWADYKEFLGEVRLNGALRNTTVSTDDIAAFAPAARDWHSVLRGVNVEVTGVVSDFTGQIRSLTLGNHTSLAAEWSVKGLPDMARTDFDLRLTRLVTDAGDAVLLARNFGGRTLPAGTVRMLRNARGVDLAADFRGSLSSFDVRMRGRTGVGRLQGDLRVRPAGQARRISGGLRTQEFHLGRLLGREPLLGDMAASAHLDGELRGGKLDAVVEAEIPRLQLRGYDYRALQLTGRLSDRLFDGVASARDPNLEFNFKGKVDFTDSLPSYDFTMDLHGADLAALGINRRDSVSTLSGFLTAKATGGSLDDLNGSIVLSDATYRYNDKRIDARRISLMGANSAESKLVMLRSDFADATFRSQTSYRVIFDYLRESAWKYLPLLRTGERTAGRGDARREIVADDYSLLSVTVRDINPIADALSSGLQVAGGSTLQLFFNPASDRLQLKVSSDYVERRRMLATRMNLNAVNRGDSLVMYASAEDLYTGRIHLPQLSVAAGARMGRVELSAGFTDTLRRAAGSVSLEAALVEGSDSVGRRVELRMHPSQIRTPDRSWEIYSDRILIDTARIAVDRFVIAGGDQELSVAGVASRSRGDSLLLRLRNFDMGMFSRMTNDLGYEISGATNGTATMKSVLRDSEITADITVDSLSVNGIAGPPLRLVSNWDFARNRAGVTVVDRDRDAKLIEGFYMPAQGRYYARVDIDSLNMGLLDPLLSGVISATRGKASADLTLQGQRREASIAGSIRIRDLETTVDYTRVSYRIPEVVLSVEDNRLHAAGVPVFDRDGNSGRMNFDLNLQHLSNIVYDVQLTPEQMLVLDTSAEDNDLFYGRIFASGRARIRGDKGQVSMNITAATDDNSSFSMPLSSKTNISNADFVVFEKPRAADSLDDVARRKLLFERKRRQQFNAENRLEISLALDVRPNVDVDISVAGNSISARGAGMFNLRIVPQQSLFEMYGDYTVAEGSYMLSLQNLINKRFTVESGSTIQWIGEPMDARLDIDAVYKLKTSLQPLMQGTTDKLSSDRSVPVECVIHLGERLTNPEVTFDVRVPGTDPETESVVANALTTPEQVDQQFLSLLVLGNFMSENNFTSGSNFGGSGLSAGTGLEVLTGMLSNLISDNVVLRYRPKSELASDEIDFGLSQSLINDRLFVEFEGNYLLDSKYQATNSASNFMGEAYITYLIDRAGTLRAKAFTQTIDRFDENQGLQETGVGIYYKEDFDNFRDFRRRVKERFTNRKRKARREARLAAREAEEQRLRDEAAAAERAREEAEQRRAAEQEALDAWIFGEEIEDL